MPDHAVQPAATEPTAAMVDAYLQAQRRTVEEADRFGRPNVGGLHTDTVREACRAGLRAAIAVAAQPARAGGDAPLTHAELLEIKRAIADFEDCGETDVPDSLLMRAVHAGYLECSRYNVLNSARDDLDAALRAAPQAAAASVVGLGESHITVLANVDQPVAVAAPQAQEVEAALIDLGIDGGEHHLQPAGSALPHDATPVMATQCGTAALQPAASTVPATSWGQAIEQAVDEFLADYEMRGEDAEGRDGYYTPTADELFVIKDAFMGLMVDDAWIAAYHGAHGIVGARRRP